MNEYAGRSLAFMRQIKRLPPKYGSVGEAMRDTEIVWSDPGEAIPVGHLVWFENDGPAGGDVGIALPNNRMLCLVDDGVPVIRPIFDYDVDLAAPVYQHGTYVGHSATIGPAEPTGKEYVPHRDPAVNDHFPREAGHVQDSGAEFM